MQSTTTSVLFGLVADLSVPGPQSACTDTNQPSFDTLLGPNAWRAAAAPTDSSIDSADAPQNRSQPASSEEQPGSFEAVGESDEPLQSNAEQSSATDELLVASRLYLPHANELPA